MRLLICAGGTGGGVYPALTVAEKLQAEAHTLLWVGGEGGMEADLISRTTLPYQAIPAAGVHGISLVKLPGNLVKLFKGYQRSKQIIKQFKPDALFFTGGYVAIPMALAGHGIPILLYVPDIEPALALKVLSRLAKKIAVTVDATRQYFKKTERITVTGYPLRENIKKWHRTEANAYFKFDPKVKTLLFMGGSSGARSINNAVIANIEALVEHYQVIHLTGHLDWESVQKRTAHLGQRYQAFPYLHEVGAAYAAADLVISRSGASTLGEYPYFGLPAILVPYPYAWRYQKVNADYLVDHKAAIILEDNRLMTDLVPTVISLINDPARLASMRHAMNTLSEPDSAQKITALLYDMAEA